jgi:uncharacterized protein
LALILDSGGVLVAIDPDQNDHAAFADALASHRGPLVISPFVVAELDYMIARDYGGDARLAFRLAFLDEVDRGAYRLEAFGAADFSRARTLMDAYSHLTGFGIADASNVVLAKPWRSVTTPRISSLPISGTSVGSSSQAVAISASSPTTSDRLTETPGHLIRGSP